MPPKRKAPAEPLPSEPSRRKLRSDGPATPAKPPPKPRATRRVANAKQEPEVSEPPEPKEKKSEPRATRSRAVAGPSKTEKAPPKRTIKKTVVAAMKDEPTVEVESTVAPKRRGKPPGVRPAEVQEAVQVKPPSKKPPATKPPPTKPPSTKPSSRTSTRISARTIKAKAGPSKSTTKATRPRTTTKGIPTVVEEGEPEGEEDEEPVPRQVPPRPTTPVRTRIIMDAVEIVTPGRPLQPFAPNRNTPKHPKPSPTKPPSTLPPVISAQPITPSRSRRVSSPPTTLGRKRRQNERSRSPEPSQMPYPSKRVMRSGALTTPGTTRIAKLPAHYHPCLQAQKRAIMAALRSPPELDAEEDQNETPSTNELAYDDLCDLLMGSVVRGEGNSCLLIGPRGSGKTRLVDRTLAQVSKDVSPIVIRLSGHVQQNDRLAIREIAWQLSHQTGKQITLDDEEDGGNPGTNEDDTDLQDVASLPPPAYLPSLISTLPSQPKPVVVVLDAFDEFALHGRQALLYCLLDTVQSCRVGSGLNGLAVIGVTNRVDTINLLEKRVKSRFSGRMLRTAGPRSVQDWWRLTRGILTVPLGKEEDVDGWKELWGGSVNRFLEERSVKTALHETWALVKDVRMLTRILTTPVLTLSPASPFLIPAGLFNSIAEQRCPVGNPFLTSLSYPAICLLIASVHTQTAGHDTFTFEMLHQLFRDQVRISIAAPVQIEGGGSIGMVKCSRQVMMGAFEHLVSVRVFVGVSAASSMVRKEFVKYRSSVEREEVKKTVEKLGTMSLKKWLGKSQQVHN